MAPSDERMASSLALKVARANCMFMTLTQAMSKTPMQKANMVSSMPVMNDPVNVVMSGRTNPRVN